MKQGGEDPRSGRKRERKSRHKQDVRNLRTGGHKKRVDPKTQSRKKSGRGKRLLEVKKGVS